MIECIKETKQIIAETVVAKIIKCDVCGKVINDDRKREGSGIQDHYELTTGHNDRGNDSCESMESFDLCSKECLTKKFQEYIETSSGNANSQYFNVEHNWHSKQKEVDYEP